MRAYLLLSGFFTLLSIWISPAFCQEKSKKSNLGDIHGTLVHASNVTRYRSSLVPEIYSLVLAGLVDIDVVEDLDTQQFITTVASPQDPRLENWIQDKGTLQGPLDCDISPVFFVNRHAKQHDYRDAYRILWNVESNLWSKKNIGSDFRVIQMPKDGSVREIEGRLDRIYNMCFEEYQKGGQLYRQRLVLNQPKFLANFSWLGFNFYNHNSDILWIHSAVLGQTRRVSSSNRSDPVGNTIFNLEDFLAWSGNLVQQGLSGVEQVYALAPVMKSLAKVKKASGKECLQLNWTKKDRPLAKETMSRWSSRSLATLGQFAWNPDNLVYQERELWRIKLVSKDPYTLYGQQVLYIDTASLIPVFKIVYDQAGTLWKSLITVPLFYSENEDQKYSSFPVLTYLYDHKLKTKALVAYYNINFCNNLAKEPGLAYFDPDSLNSYLDS